MKRRIYTLALLLTLSVAPAFGQGCAMCYTSAKGASPKAQQALTRAILVLLVPAVSMMGGIVAAGFHYSRKRDRENEGGS